MTIQISELSPLRSKEHLGLLRLRFADISKATGYFIPEVMQIVFESCGLGHYLETRKQNPFTKFFLPQFERVSTNVLTKADINKILKKLDEWLIFWNTDIESDKQFKWRELK